MVRLAVLVVVLTWSTLSGPVCTASEENDPQNFTVLDWFRRLLCSSAIKDVIPACEDSVEDDDYSDHEANEKADDEANEKANVCKGIAKSTLHERFLVALDHAKRTDRPWWFTFFGAFTDAGMSCPANEDKLKEGATLHERFMRSVPGFISWLQVTYVGAVTTATEWLYEAYSSGVTILLLPVLIGWLFERVSKLLHLVQAGVEWNLVPDTNSMHSTSKLALVVEHSLQGEESFAGPVVPGDASTSDAATIPSDQAVKESVAATTGAMVAALQESSEAKSRESVSLGSTDTRDKSPRRP